ncbi:hypothetical protein Aperf_G00000070623 [Anoplocephala perfoliata]
MDSPFGRQTYQDMINFYERKTDEALSNASKHRILLEKSYISAIESIEKAIEFIEREKCIYGTACEKYGVLEARERSLKSRLQLMQPYRSFLKRYSPSRPSEENTISGPNTSDAFVFLAHEHDTPPPNPCRSSAALRLCPKNKEERFEECEIRICELEKMVDCLSLKLQESERRAEAEENARLIAEGQLLMMSRQNQLASPPDLSDTNFSELDTSTHRPRSSHQDRFFLSCDYEDGCPQD